MTSLNHEIRFGNKLRKELASFGGFQIERDAALVVVEAEPEEALFRVRLIAVKRTESSCWIASRRFDLDDIRAQIP